MNESGRCDQCIPVGARCWNLHRRGSARDRRVNGQDPSIERGQKLSFEPGSKARALYFIATLDQQDARL